MPSKGNLDWIRASVAGIPDPEIPVITLADLGILRDVAECDDGSWLVTITPTYSGCPAMQMIEQSIVEKLQAQGIRATVKLVLDPAWTTDWITAEGRQKLKDYGIAPPAPRSHRQNEKVVTVQQNLAVPLFRTVAVSCPRCDSANTARVSAFGATACKELWRCDDCHEPFEHFKCH